MHPSSKMMGLHCVLLVLTVLFVAAEGTTLPRTKQPHIIHILADDLGWAEVGYHNEEARLAGDIKTPNIDKLARTGLQLDRFYSEKICSPTRSAMLSGRFGIHVNQQNVVPESVNPADPIGGYQGIPVNMTVFAEKLSSAGYMTNLVGKWDVGMATPEHSPASRGFDSWLGYWHHSNDYFTHAEEKCYGQDVRDLWAMKKDDPTSASRERYQRNGPAVELQNGPSCSDANQVAAPGELCEYEEQVLVDEVLRLINTYESTTSTAVTKQKPPLYLLYSMHLVHMPLEIQQEALDLFDHIHDEYRKKMHAMVYTMDNYIGQIVEALHRNGMWEDTLLVFHSDNGGEIMTQFCGGNNYPLRGGKFSQFEGGIRVNAVVNGGYLPVARRGKLETGLMSVADWYATFLAIAGLDDKEVIDQKAIAASLPPLDSVNCWPLISGQTTSCRNEIAIGDTSALGFNQDGQALVGALISGQYKLLLGPANKNFHVGQDVLTGPFYPNITMGIPELHPKVCNRQPIVSEGGSGSSHEGGCLYDIFADPSETNNLAASHSNIFLQMLQRLDEIQTTTYSPDRGKRDPQACEQAKENGFYWGPFLDMK